MKNIKKYILWLIVWIMSAWLITYAADTWTIWSLFEQLPSWNWVLNWNNIKDATIAKVKLSSLLQGSIDDISTNTTAINTINSKINLGSNWTIAPNWNNLEFKYNWVTKIIFGSDWSITAKQYNLN